MFSENDRFLVTDDILASFHHITCLVLKKKIPYVHPTLQLEHRVYYAPTPFRLFHSWFKMDAFDGVVQESWLQFSNGVVFNNPWVVFKKKLELLKSNLGVWNSRNQDLISTKKKNLQELIKSIDSRLMGDDGSTTLKEQMVSLLKELLGLDHVSQVELARNEQIQWDIKGDKNFGHFHEILNRKSRQIANRGLMIDKVQVDNLTRVSEDFHAYYQSLLFHYKGWHPLIDASHFSTLAVTQVDILHSSFNQEEIKRAVWDYRSSKALGINDFTFGFIKHY